MAGTGTLSVRWLSWLIGTHTSTGDLASAGPIISFLNTVPNEWTDGAASGAFANRIYADRHAQASGADKQYLLYDFGGARDELGRTYALTKVKGIWVYNRGNEMITINYDDGAASGTGVWKNMSTNAGVPTAIQVELSPGGVFQCMDRVGWDVPDGDDSFLIRPDAPDIEFDIVILGTQ